jgi:hypothetical protein
MRVEKEIKYSGVTDSGILLIDKEGTSYHWITKQKDHPLLITNDWVNVRMCVSIGTWGNKITNNVKLIK